MLLEFMREPCVERQGEGSGTLFVEASEMALWIHNEI